MKMILPFLAVCCFALAGVGCKSTCGSSCGHDHAAKCCGKCDGAKKECCGKCGGDKAKACPADCTKPCCAKKVE